MTQLFRDMRLYGHVFVFLLAVTVLGIDAYLASIFLPNLHPDFTIFALVVPSLTILIFFILNSWSRPIMEAIATFILGVLWLTMGAWSTDILGNIQCDTLGGQRTPTKSGSISAKSYCYEMKVIEAFSWMNFCLFTIFLWILITLTSRAKAFGRYGAWYEPIFELPWFGQYPGNESGGPPGRYNYAYPAGSPAYPGHAYPTNPQMSNGGYVVSQQPGHSVVIQPQHGGPPVVTQVPGIVQSA
ncbi:uncharacterized protein PHACADRAFT_249255 [Phanerochaete carnosa HHB-10118-sp]|uniref:MARVEL domain-containing protein n=1 Tax=Phanerochaete carnosa (strain HHB-10118-sp) TaxID=650164 RepID=K5X862_PHACS|nr:uncharacterized protein PHACADRAFT_249255 [Phanerochaete carnosa HHB-10118-sp]EKM59067.1 hypothetical protein PHACADRAFT_249255 [Phanerochaete carnosa HHB-10118-sp]